MSHTTTANRLPFPAAQLIKSDGMPADGWTYNFYLSGTSTPASVYSDLALTVPVNNLELNSYGMPQVDIYLDPDVNYKLVVEDDVGTPIFTWNNVKDFARQAVAHFQVYAGNPNGNVEGTAGVVGGSPADAIFDTTNNIIWVCTTTGTDATAVWTNVSAALTGAVVMSGVLSPTSISTQQNDYNPTDLATASSIRLNPGADVDITGIVGGASGRLLTLINTSSTYKVTLRNQNTASSVANRFLTGPDVIMLPNTAAMVQYDAATGRWRLRSPPIFNEPMGQCLLSKSGANLLLSRSGGSLLFINGTNQQIPAAGLTLAPPATTDTTYFIYAYMNGFVMTLEYDTVTNAVDATYGNPIKSGDGTRTLVGMARTVSSAWTDTAAKRFVRSYYNDPGLGLNNSFTTDRTTASTSYAEINSEIRIEFLIWTGETILVSASGRGTNSGGVNTRNDCSFGFNGTTAENICVGWNSGGSQGSGFSIPSFAKSGLTQGYNYCTLLGLVTASTGTWTGSATAGERTTLNGYLRR